MSSCRSGRYAKGSVGLAVALGVLFSFVLASGTRAGTLLVGAASASSGTAGLEANLGCQPSDLLVPAGTVDSDQFGCTSITAGNVEVVAPGSTFTAGVEVVLENGFSVAPGAFFEAAIQPLLNSTQAFVQDDGPIVDSTYNARFRLRLNPLMLAPGEEIGHLTAHGVGGGLVFRLNLRRNPAGTQDLLVLSAWDDVFGALREHPVEFNLPGGFNTVQVEWRAGSGNGSLQVSIAGGALAGLTDLSNATQAVDFVRWGSVDGTPTGGGSMDLDEFSSWRSELREIPTRVTAFDGATNDEFGRRVTIDGDTMVVGVPRDTTAGGQTGSAYVYVRGPSGAWTLQQKLIASDADPGDRFGSAVDVAGDFIAIGARSTDNNPAPPPGTLGNSGSAYIFRRSGAVWTEEIQLLPKARPDGRSVGGMRFGDSIGIDTSVPEENPGGGAITTVVVGAPQDQEFFPPANFPRVGSIYLYTRSPDGTGWNEGPRFSADDAFPTGSTFADFGSVVAIGGDGIIVGSPGWNRGAGQPVIGHAYFYSRTSILSVWAAKFIFEASDAVDGDRFGDSVAIESDGAGEYQIVVGAPLVDDPGVGADTGAAYVFQGNTNLWTERILGSSDPAADARFGDSVGVSLPLVAIGEPGRDLPSAVNGAGTVHVFRLALDEEWGHLGRIEAPTPMSQAGLGTRLGISGENVAAGAPLEDEGAATVAGATHVFGLRSLIFADGFESGDLSAWSGSVP